MIKYIMIALLLTGCTQTLTEKEKTYLRDVAKIYCSCRGGIEKLDFYIYLKEATVTCNERGFETLHIHSEYNFKECKND